MKTTPLILLVQLLVLAPMLSAEEPAADPVTELGGVEVSPDDAYDFLRINDITSEWTNNLSSVEEGTSTEFDFKDEPDLLLRDELFRAYDFMEKGDLDKSLQHFREAFKRNPKNLRVRFGLGTLYAQMQNNAKAIEMFDWLLTQTPYDYRVHNNLAWLFCTTADTTIRDTERGLYHAQTALLSAPGSYNVWSTLAECYYAAQLFDKAERAARMAYALSVERGAPDMMVVLYQEQMDRCRKAAQAFSVLH